MPGEAQADEVRELAAFVRDTHPLLVGVVARQQFTADAERLVERAPGLDRAAYVVEVHRLLAGLGDPHTTCYPLPLGGPFDLRLPLITRPLGTGIYVLAAAPDARALVGRRLTAIGGLSIVGVAREIAGIWPHGNEAWVERWLPALLRRPAYLMGLGIVRADGPIVVSTEDPAGGVRDTPVTAAKMDAEADRRDWQWVGDAPLLAPGDRDVGLGLEVRDRALIVTYGGSSDTPQRSVAQLAAEVLAAAAQVRAERLIVDLRDNGGGDNELNVELQEAVARVVREGRRLYVLIGPATFSAGMNIATWLERRTPATFVGEPTGLAPNHFGDVVFKELPSGLSVIVSTRWWQDSEPDDHRPWILPDIPVRPQVPGDLVGSDRVLEMALADHSPPPDDSRDEAFRRPSQRRIWPPAWATARSPAEDQPAG